VIQLGLRVRHRELPSTCALCGRRLPASGALELVVLEDRATVCQPCGKKHEPALAAVVELARVAERVGHVGRHTFVPSLASLLDLAHAAEEYTHARLPAKRQAA
jgi:hypothetical protein